MTFDLAIRIISITGGLYLGWVLLAGGKDEKLYADRIAKFIVPARSAEVVSFSAIKPEKKETLPAFRAFLRWMHIDLSRKDQYPSAWPVILLLVALFSIVGAILLGSVMGKFIAFAVMCGVGIFATRSIFGAILEKRRNLQLSQFPDALNMMVRSLSVGVSIQEVFSSVAKEAPFPTCDEFKRYTSQIAMGVEMADALREMADRSGLIEYRFFVTTLIIQAQSGGKLSDTLDSLASTVRKRIALKERGVALSSEARASAMILAGLPFFLEAVMFFMNEKYAMILFVDPLGRFLFVLGVVMLVAGFLVMRGIIRKTLS